MTTSNSGTTKSVAGELLAKYDAREDQVRSHQAEIRQLQRDQATIFTDVVNRYMRFVTEEFKLWVSARASIQSNWSDWTKRKKVFELVIPERGRGAGYAYSTWQWYRPSEDQEVGAETPGELLFVNTLLPNLAEAANMYGEDVQVISVPILYLEDPDAWEAQAKIRLSNEFDFAEIKAKREQERKKEKRLRELASELGMTVSAGDE